MKICKNGNLPEELLNSSFEERRQYFAGFSVRHPNLDKAIEETLRHIRSLVDERIILVCGPSGVGKKEFINGISQQIIEAEENNPNKVLGCIPVVKVEAIAPKDGSFDFYNLWISVLEEMDEPRMKPINAPYDVDAVDKNGNKVTMSKVKKGDYEKVLINTLKYRQVKAFIVDEAHHTLMVATDKKANWSVNVWKSLASCNRPIVLVGTYELLKYLELRSEFVDQIIRRTRIVIFPRYFKNVNDLDCFAAAAKELIINMPFEEIDTSIISKNLEYLFENSLGRIGALKLWLMDAFAYAIDQQAQYLTKEHLDATKTSKYLLTTVLKGIESGEQRMAMILSDGKFGNSLIISNKNKDKSLEKSASTKNPPFERKPGRDAAHVGLVNVVVKGDESFH